MGTAAILFWTILATNPIVAAENGGIAQTLGYCGATTKAWVETRADLQQELSDDKSRGDAMLAKVTMLRNEAAQMRDFTSRDVLLINADLWQSQIDAMKTHANLLQEKIDRCDARAKIADAAASKPNSKMRKESPK